MVLNGWGIYDCGWGIYGSNGWGSLFFFQEMLKITGLQTYFNYEKYSKKSLI